MTDLIGEFVEMSGDFHGEWRIPEFLTLPEEKDIFYWSGTFFYSDACWELKMYPNGETDLQSDGCIGLYLHRRDCGPPLTLRYSLGVRKAGGFEEFFFQRDSRPFLKEKGGWGAAKFLTRSDLLNRMSDLLPSGALTITCILKNDCQHSTDISLCRRLWNTSLSLQSILNSQEKTDITLKLEDGEIRAHRIILEARSDVFNRMFATDMRESQTGEVNVEEADKSSFTVALAYAYSGEPAGLSSTNVSSVYRIAHKYNMEKLVRLCSRFMLDCLTVDSVCDVIAVAEVYQEEAMMERARDFFLNNAAEIVKAHKWKTLKKENPAIVSELLESIVVDNVTKIKI